MHYKNKIIEEIYNAIGTKKNFSDGVKRRFAEELANELQYIFIIAKDKAQLKSFYTNLGDSARNAEAALKLFNNCILEARKAFKSINKLSVFLGTSFTKDCDLQRVLKCFEIYNSNLAALQLPKEKTQHDNIPSYYAAITTARLYTQFLSPTFTTGKGEITASRTNAEGTLKQTPFDRVCAVIEKYYKLQISAHIRELARKHILHGMN